MDTEDFISTAPLVAITNLELVEITWLCQIFYQCEKGTPKEQITFLEVKNRLTNYGALIFNCTPVHDLKGVGAYKILSSMHGWFKGTLYEKQAFFQICLDESNEDTPQYALLSISDYNNGSEHNQEMLQRYETHFGVKGHSG